MTLHWHSVDWSIVAPALVAGLLVLSTHVPLGQRVLRKGIVFIDLAIAQIAGLGVMVASIWGGAQHAWVVQASAAGFALLGAVLLTYMERHWPDIQEALIGTLFVVTSCAGILLLSGHPHGGEHLKDLLVGQILWVTPDQLWPMAALSAVVLLIWLAGQAWMGSAGFYVLFALAVTASVQLVGVYLVFSSLIMPALAVRNLHTPWRAGVAWGLGAVAYALGLCLSAMLDWPSGAIIVLCMAAICGAFAVTLSRLKPQTRVNPPPSVRRSH